MEWAIEYFGDAVQQRILLMPAQMQARYIHLTERMVTFGPALGMPHTRSLGQGLFELRMKSKEGIGRVFFGIPRGRRIVMLHAFVKRSQKTPSREIKIARGRLKELLDDVDS